MPDSTLDEVDRAVVHAVERSPRGTWRSLGDIIGVDPATVARRWARLEREGLAWVTCYPLLTRDPASALIDITCAIGSTEEAAAAIARHPEVLFVDVVAGASDILITAATVDQQRLSDYVLRRLPTVPGVEEVETHPIVSVHFEGGYSAAGSLERRASARLPVPDHGVLVRANVDVDDVDWQLCIALGRDGRQPVAELARATGLAQSAVARRLNRLSAQGVLRMIVELTPDAAGSAVGVWISARVPARSRPAAVRSIAELAGVRAISSVAGPENFVFKASLTHLAALDDFETRISEVQPDLVIVDRKVILRPVRSMSRILDAAGHAVEVSPIDLRPR